MRKLSYKIYHKLFFYFWIKGSINFFNPSKSKDIIESKIFISWLRLNTKYFIEKWLESLYKAIKEYNGQDTKGILQYPSQLKEIARYSYLVRHIGMGYHPTLKTNPITLQEILDLNPYKKDTNWTLFLKNYMSQYWNNPDRRITRNQLNKTLNA